MVSKHIESVMLTRLFKVILNSGFNYNNLKRINIKTRLEQDLGITDLEIFDFISDIEIEYNLDPIDNETIQSFINIFDIIQYITKTKRKIK